MRRSNDEGRYRMAETLSKSSEPTRVRTSMMFSSRERRVRAWFRGFSAEIDCRVRRLAWLAFTQDLTALEERATRAAASETTVAITLRDARGSP